MKKLIAILALIAAGSTANAADVSFSTVDNNDGTATVSWAGTEVLGMALDVTVNSGALTGTDMSGFNVYIDEAYSLGEITELPVSNPKANVDGPGKVDVFTSPFALCAGYLAANNPGLAAGTITFTATETTTLTLSENAKRGGIVDKAGKSTAVGLPLAVTATKAPAVCKGDMNGDKVINFTDLVQFKQAFGKPAVNPASDFNGDGNVNFVDLVEFKKVFGKPCN